MDWDGWIRIFSTLRRPILAVPWLCGPHGSRSWTMAWHPPLAGSSRGSTRRQVVCILSKWCVYDVIWNAICAYICKFTIIYYLWLILNYYYIPLWFYTMCDEEEMDRGVATVSVWCAFVHYTTTWLYLYKNLWRVGFSIRWDLSSDQLAEPLLQVVLLLMIWRFPQMGVPKNLWFINVYQGKCHWTGWFRATGNHHITWVHVIGILIEKTSSLGMRLQETLTACSKAETCSGLEQWNLRCVMIGRHRYWSNVEI